MDIEIPSLKIDSTSSITVDNAIKSFLNSYHNHNEEFHLLCTLGEEYAISFIKEFDKYKTIYPNLKVFIFDLVDDIYDNDNSLKV